MKILVTNTRFVVVIIALAVAGIWGEEPHAQPSGPPAVEQPVAKPDTRVALGLAPAAQESLKATMREHLDAIEVIVRALARAEYDKAAGVAHAELGFPKHHQAMQREGNELPKRYMELAIDHHQAAEDLAEAISTKKMASILQQLDRTIQACNACHRAYKL